MGFVSERMALVTLSETNRIWRRLQRCVRNALRLKSCWSACRRPALPEVCTALVVCVERAGTTHSCWGKRDHEFLVQGA